MTNIPLPLELYGLNSTVINKQNDLGWDNFELAKVTAQHKDLYEVFSNKGKQKAEITGRLRYTATSALDFPVVGDWVVLLPTDEDLALIHGIVTRNSLIKRKKSGRVSESQALASNIDFALIVQSVNRDFNTNRIERYLSICLESDVVPWIVLNKIDLIPSTELENKLAALRKRIHQVPTFALSVQTGEGMEGFKNALLKEKSYCLLGSSGVGKSSLLNSIHTDARASIASIGTAERGKHTTTSRSLFLCANGSIFIDTPGIREVGLTDTNNGLQATFDSILMLSDRCKFNDCKHVHENGCAVIAALENGELNSESYEHFIKLQKEQAYFQSSVAELKQKDKGLAKRIKEAKRIKKNRK